MNLKQQAYEGSYQGESAVWLKAGVYEAAVLPEHGANLIAFRDIEKGYRFLCEPNTMDEFKAKPIVNGIPVLFPPNRYEDGKFPWDGKVYDFPVNEIDTNNHLHGFLYGVPWAVENYGTDNNASRVTLCLTVDEQHDIYAYFPHTFTVRLTYTLSSAGLHQHVFIQNEGTSSMPCLLAFHTAFNAPFDPKSTEQDMTYFVTIGDRYNLDERMLPTGKLQPLNEGEQRMKSTGASPFFEVMDNHYSAVPQQGRNRMELIDNKSKTTLVYDVGNSYKYWMIWNKDASSGLICVEPHINMVNAPNLDLPAEDIGLIGLEPGEIWEETSRLYVK